MTLTNEDLIILKKPFQPREHYFTRGFAYIKESGIADRLEEVDPAWSFQIIETQTREGTITVTGRLIVKGVIRDNMGMAQVMSKDDGSEVNEAEKAAATDAFKRCARLFGVGRYLLDAPKNLTVDSLAKWLKENFAKLPAAPEGKPKNF